METGPAHSACSHSSVHECLQARAKGGSYQVEACGQEESGQTIEAFRNRTNVTRTNVTSTENRASVTFQLRSDPGALGKDREPA